MRELVLVMRPQEAEDIAHYAAVSERFRTSGRLQVLSALYFVSYQLWRC
jgi:hypothetical protein